MVVEACEHVQLLPGAPALSHGLGGETVLMLGAIVIYAVGHRGASLIVHEALSLNSIVQEINVVLLVAD